MAQRRRKPSFGGSALRAEPSSKVLLKTTDFGKPVTVNSRVLGFHGDRWVEPFLEANRFNLRRLDVKTEIRIDPIPRVDLYPGKKIGAVPLFNPANRKVAGGLLVEPRFKWSALGSVFNSIGFSVEPSLGGSPLVPGSAREVPPWLLAAPVIERIAKMLKHRRRGFVPTLEKRNSPRGRVDWLSWASNDLSTGNWTRFPCSYSEPDDDPNLMGAVRWTLRRLREELSSVAWTAPGRNLLGRASQMQTLVGPGPLLRPTSSIMPIGSSEWVSEAVEAMGWVADERGLAGSRTLDGLAWDLSVEEVWEAWVWAFAGSLSQQLGMTVNTFKGTRKPLHWEGAVKSMGSLAPDIELRGNDITILMDAKYKPHFSLLRRKGWPGLSEDVRAQHRADIHQALAYSSMSPSNEVFTILAYPGSCSDSSMSSSTRILTGKKRLTMVIASLPFGFHGIGQKQKAIQYWKNLVRSY